MFYFEIGLQFHVCLEWESAGNWVLLLWIEIENFAKRGYKQQERIERMETCNETWNNKTLNVTFRKLIIDLK